MVLGASSVSLSGRHMNIGMDCSRFASLAEAMRKHGMGRAESERLRRSE
jgi:hypothetical protein